MLVSGAIFTCLLLLVAAEPYKGYELGNYVGLLSVYHDRPRFDYVKFPTDDSSRIIRKSPYREYEHPPSDTYYPTEYSNFHHGPSYHGSLPPPPNHGPPRLPTSRHRRPPSNSYGPPPPSFEKPHSYHHGPHHNRYPFHHHHPPPAFDSSENYNYGSWESQEYDDTTENVKDCKGTSRNPRPGSPPKQPIFSTSFSALPSKTPGPSFQSSLPPTPLQTVTNAAGGINIATPNGLISGNSNHANCQHQSTLLTPPPPPHQSNNLVTSSRPDLSSQGPDVSSLINGVFQNSGQQFGQQTRPNIPTSPGSDVDSLIAEVFPGSVAQQNSQAQQQSTPPTSTSNIDSLLGGVFPSLNTQNNLPQQQNVPNTPTTNIDGLVAGVFSPTSTQNTQTLTQNIPASSGTNVDNIIAGVFPSLSQNQQNLNPSVATAPSTANGLISGMSQGLPPQGGRIPQSSSPFIPQTNQNNGGSIPVFQPDFPTSSNQQQNSGINSSQNVPTFQPPIADASDNSGVKPAGSGNGENTGSSNNDDSPAFDIDIRLGQIGEEVTPNMNQRNGAPST